MSPVLIIVLPAILYLLVRYPFALAVLALFLPMESPGVGTAIGRTFKTLVPLIYAGYFLAVFRTLYDLWTRRKASFVSRRTARVALTAAGVIGWIAFSTLFASDVSKIEAVNRSLGAVPGVLFALAYYNDRRARILLVLAVAVHLLIGCALIAFPYSPLAIFRGVGSEGALPDVWSLETTIHKDRAQFESAVQLAFYAAFAVIVGMSLALYRRKPLIRIAGACLASLGLAATFFTIERGIWIGILAGIFVLIAPLRRRSIGKAICVSLVFGALIVCMNSDNALLAAVRDHFLSVREDSYRIPVAIRSLDILITRPLFGTGGEVLDLINLAGGAPHQSFYFYAVAYGIPAGVLVAILTWWTIAVSFSKRRLLPESGLDPLDHVVARSLGWVVAAMAMTNGMSGGMLGWICLGFACLPYAHSAFRSPQSAFPVTQTALRRA